MKATINKNGSTEEVNLSKNNIVTLIIIIAIMVCVSIIFAILVIVNSFYVPYDIEDYTINAKVMNNGNIQVEEFLKYKFDKSMNGVSRDLLYKYNYSSQKDDMEQNSSRYQANSIINIKAYDSNDSFNNMQASRLYAEDSVSNGMSGVYSITDMISDGYRKNVKVYTPSKRNSYKYVKYTYEIEDVAVKYNDKGEIYWNFIGGDWQCKIKNLNINISFENNTNLDSVKVFPHSYVKDLAYKINDNVINISSKNISSGVALDARLVFDDDVLDYATKTRYDNYDFNTLEKIENKMSFDRVRYLVSNMLYFVIGIIAVLVLVVIIKKFRKIANKGLKNKKDIEIYTDILNNLELSQYAMLYSKNSGFGNPNLLLATILDLSNRKYILMDARKKLAITKYSYNSSIEYDYIMRLNSSKDYSELTDYEIKLINYLFNMKIGNITNIEEFSDDEIELNDRLMKLSRKTNEINKYTKYCTRKTEAEKDIFYEKTPKGFKVFSIISVIFIVAFLFINILLISPLYFQNKPVLLVISTIISVYYITAVSIMVSNSRSVKKEYIDEYTKLKGLEKYLKEYSLLKERYPIELVLWGKYLVFASLFGIADTVAKEFKEELIKAGYDTDYIYSTYPILNVSMASSSIRSSIRSSSSTGSSSSGGSSGGGSGGGGGRRPVVAVPSNIQKLIVKKRMIFHALFLWPVVFSTSIDITFAITMFLLLLIVLFPFSFLLFTVNFNFKIPSFLLNR